MERLAALLDHPEKRFHTVHVAGTNGKGSTAAMIEAGLHAAGRITGLYTSPHLVRFNERVRLNGEDISDEAFAAAVAMVRAANERFADQAGPHAHPTFFESMTAAAFSAFRDSRIEWSVVEVGLGGRLDATNIVEPELAVITSIDFDHEAYLGNSAGVIAVEKTGILKPGAKVVTAPQRPEAMAVIKQRARELGVELIRVGVDWKAKDLGHNDGRYRFDAVRKAGSGAGISVELALLGAHQIENALAAIAALDALGVQPEAIRTGLRNVRWPGRLERAGTRPEILLDAAHNPSGARVLAKFLREHRAGRRIFLLYGVVRDKAVEEAAGALFPCVDRVILTRSQVTRSLSPQTLLEIVDHHHHDISLAPTIGEGLAQAKAEARPDDVIVVAGSIFLAGEARDMLKVA